MEADPDKVSSFPVVSSLGPRIFQAQVVLHDYSRFLTQLRGRGGFYTGVGALCLVQCFFCGFFVVGSSFLFVGVICIMLSYGYTPDLEVAAEKAALAARQSLQR